MKADVAGQDIFQKQYATIPISVRILAVSPGNILNISKHLTPSKMVLKLPYHVSLNLSLNIICAEVDICESYAT
jgi:hypothetical protein